MTTQKDMQDYFSPKPKEKRPREKEELALTKSPSEKSPEVKVRRNGSPKHTEASSEADKELKSRGRVEEGDEVQVVGESSKRERRKDKEDSQSNEIQRKEPKEGTGKSKKKTYSQATGINLGPLLPQFQAYRISISFPIDKPSSKAKRISALSKGLNKFLEIAKKVAYKSRTVYVRKFKEHRAPKDAEKTEWIKSFDKTKIAHLLNYTHGFYPYQALRKGIFRFRLQIMIPVQDNPQDFITNANELFGETEQWKVQDIDAQELHEPTDVGWLFRSNWTMASSTELKDILQKKINKVQRNVPISLSSKTISPPGKYVYDKDTAVQAVMVSCNAEDYQVVSDIMFKIYNTGEKPPLGINMKFIATKDHPEVKNNSVALQNLSVLIDRQRVFKEKTQYVLCKQLSFPDEEVETGVTLRQKLMELSPLTSSDEHKEAKLFIAITKQKSQDGAPMYYFTFHDMFAMEANSIIGNLGVFIRDEMGLDPDNFCYPSAVNPNHKWDPRSRTCITRTGTFMTTLVGDTADLCIEDTTELMEQEDVELTSKEGREFRRTVGLDETETVTSMTKKRPIRKSKVPEQVGGDAKSVRSELSGLTNYSSSTKASLHRKELRMQVENQKDTIATKDDEIAKLKELLRQAQDPKARGSRVKQTKNQEVGKLNTTEADDDVSFSDSTMEDQTNQREIAEYPPMDMDGQFDVHGFVVFEKEQYVLEEWIDEEGEIPLHNPDGEIGRSIDPHWEKMGEYTREVSAYLAEEQIKKGRIVMVSRTGAEKKGKMVVYVWSIQDVFYTGKEGDNPYPLNDNIPHYLEKRDYMENPVYPPITEPEKEMEYLYDTGDTPIHNPNALPDLEIHNHWVKFVSAPQKFIRDRDTDYKRLGFRTLVSKSGADKQEHLALYLWVQGLTETGHVQYAKLNNSVEDDEEQSDPDWEATDNNKEELTSQQGSGQSSSSPPFEKGKVTFNPYSHVQRYSTADGKMIGNEEDHSLTEPAKPIQREDETSEASSHSSESSEWRTSKKENEDSSLESKAQSSSSSDDSTSSSDSNRKQQDTSIGSKDHSNSSSSASQDYQSSSEEGQHSGEESQMEGQSKEEKQNISRSKTRKRNLTNTTVKKLQSVIKHSQYKKNDNPLQRGSTGGQPGRGD